MMIKKVFMALALLVMGCKGVSQDKESTATSDIKPMATDTVIKSDAEWRKELTDIQYYVLRKSGTETAGSSELLHNNEKGTYVCAACGTALFESEYKFDSGTGWPSFDRAVEGNVEYDTDYKIGYARTEEHCAVCGGHLGHMFNDGPRATTGQRHCINGAALEFIPDSM